MAGAAVVTDTGSTKREMVDAAKALPNRLTFLGGHPLGGAARGGIEHARPNLFYGTPVALYADPGARRSGSRQADARLLQGLAPSRVRFRLKSLPRLHHRASPTHRQRPHARRRAGGGTDALSLSGRGLQDTTRLACRAPQLEGSIGHQRRRGGTRCADCRAGRASRGSENRAVNRRRLRVGEFLARGARH